MKTTFQKLLTPGNLNNSSAFCEMLMMLCLSLDALELARSGFLLFGFAGLWLAVIYHWLFVPDVSFDPIECRLHSVTTVGMGFAFPLGLFLPIT